MIYDENEKTIKLKMIKKNIIFLLEERYFEIFKIFFYEFIVFAIILDWSKWR